MDVHIRRILGTNGLYSNLTTIPKHLPSDPSEIPDWYRDCPVLWDIYFEYLAVVGDEDSFWSSHHPKHNVSTGVISDRIKGYAFKHASMDVIWNVLNETIPVDNCTGIIGAKGNYHGFIGYRNTEENSSKSAGFKGAIHIKILVSDRSSPKILDYKLFVGCGSINVTGSKNTEDIIAGMKLLIETLRSHLYPSTQEPLFFLKPHMDKLIAMPGVNNSIEDPELLKLKNTRRRINYRVFKQTMEAEGYPIIKEGNTAVVNMTCALNPDTYDMYRLSSEWSHESMSLIDINDMFTITSDTLVKEIKSLRIQKDQRLLEYQVKLEVSLVSGKINVSSNHSGATVECLHELIDIMNECHGDVSIFKET